MPQNILGFGEQYLDKILILWYNPDSVRSCFIFALKYLEKAIFEDLGGSSYRSRRLLATNRKGRTGGIMNTKMQVCSLANVLIVSVWRCVNREKA